MSTETEAWRPVVGYGSQYEVSNLGRVRGLGRSDSVRERRKIKDRFLKPFLRDQGGYLTVRFTTSAKTKTFYLHRVVLEAFVGPCPEGMECAHDNGISTDCRLRNLAWKTRRANADDRIKHGRLPKGEKHHKARLCIGDVERVRDLRRSGGTYSQIGEWLGVPWPTVADVIKRRSWTHVT